MTYIELITLGIGIANIVVVVYLVLWIKNSDKTKRDTNEKFHKRETETNLNEIKTVFRDVITIANGSGDGVWDDEEKEEITHSLNEYFSNNYAKIHHLKENTEYSLKRWITLDVSKQNKMHTALSNLSWLVEIYFPEGISMSEYQKRWITHHSDLHSRQKEVIAASDSIKTS